MEDEPRRSRTSEAFFGRRRGKTIRPAQASALEVGLQHYRLDLARPAPADLGSLFRAPVSSIRLEIGFGGGEHLRQETLTHSSTGFIGAEPFVNGMAKMMVALAKEPADNLRVFDDDAGGVPGTDPGEIVVRGPNLFSGYWPDGSGGPDGDGWWPTGDVAYADEDGDLFLVDRLGELIIVSGFNVYPHEVELVLAGFPGVAEAAVVGTPDPTTGQAVRAYVVRAADASVTEADLAAHCARNLARFKCPTSIEFVPELPHTATGKVVKGSLGRS